MLVRTRVPAARRDDQLLRANSKGHSTSESVHVRGAIRVCDFVLTVVVTIVEVDDL